MEIELVGDLEYTQTADYGIVSDEAVAMLQKLAKIHSVVNCEGVAQEDLIPVTELTEEGLGYCNLNDTPTFQANVMLPYLNPDGTPIGGFGYAHVLVHIYNDGTAVGIHRCWKYERMTLDGKPNHEDKPVGPSTNHMTIKFYQLGCVHEYRGMTAEEIAERDIHLFHCDHANICEKCGHSFVVNSSD